MDSRAQKEVGTEVSNVEDPSVVDVEVECTNAPDAEASDHEVNNALGCLLVGENVQVSSDTGQGVDKDSTIEEELNKNVSDAEKCGLHAVGREEGSFNPQGPSDMFY